MTISTTTSRVSYVGNDVTVNFAIPFPFVANADIRAQIVVDATGVVTEQILTTNFTLVGEGTASGTYTSLVAPATGETLIIFRDPALTQSVDLINNDPLPVETSVEAPLDKLTTLVQRSRDLIDRSSRLQDGDTGTTVPFELPLKSLRASQFAAWDADGDWTAAASAAPTTALVTAFAETFLDDLDAAAVRSTLLNFLTGVDIHAAAGGTVDVITASVGATALIDGMIVVIRAIGANTIAGVTFNLDSLGAKTVLKENGVALLVGDIAGTNDELVLKYNLALDDWLLLNPAIASASITPAGTMVLTQQASAVNTALVSPVVNVFTSLFPAPLDLTNLLVGDIVYVSGAFGNHTTSNAIADITQLVLVGGVASIQFSPGSVFTDFVQSEDFAVAANTTDYNKTIASIGVVDVAGDCTIDYQIRFNAGTGYGALFTTAGQGWLRAFVVRPAP